jgi:hypothetical protein
MHWALTHLKVWPGDGAGGVGTAGDGGTGLGVGPDEGDMHVSIVSTTPFTAIKSFLVTVELPCMRMTSPAEVDVRVTWSMVPSSVSRSCAGLSAVLKMSPNTKWRSRKRSRKVVLLVFQSSARVCAGSFANAESVGANIVVRSEPFRVLVHWSESSQSVVRLVRSA